MVSSFRDQRDHQAFSVHLKMPTGICFLNVTSTFSAQSASFDNKRKFKIGVYRRPQQRLETLVSRVVGRFIFRNVVEIDWGGGWRYVDGLVV